MQLNKIFDLQIKTEHRFDGNYSDSNNLEARIITLLEDLGCMCYYNQIQNLWSVFREVNNETKKDA